MAAGVGKYRRTTVGLPREQEKRLQDYLRTKNSMCSNPVGAECIAGRTVENRHYQLKGDTVDACYFFAWT